MCTRQSPVTLFDWSDLIDWLIGRKMVRVKRRYVLFELLLDRRSDLNKFREKYHDKFVYKSLKSTLEKLHGDYGVGVLMQSLSVKRFNKDTMTGIVRVQRDGLQLLSTSLPLVKQINDFGCSLRTLHLSGTMHGCLKQLQRIHQGEVNRLKRQQKQPKGEKKKEKTEQMEQSMAESTSDGSPPVATVTTNTSSPTTSATLPTDTRPANVGNKKSSNKKPGNKKTTATPTRSKPTATSSTSRKKFRPNRSNKVKVDKSSGRPLFE